ncbi:DUF2608 domain-containing protein [Escherichia coli]
MATKAYRFCSDIRAPDTLFPTLRELKRNGIDFSSSALRKKRILCHPLKKGNSNGHGCTAGVFFSSGKIKA